MSSVPRTPPLAGDKPQRYIESEQLRQKMLAIALADVS